MMAVLAVAETPRPMYGTHTGQPSSPHPGKTEDDDDDEVGHSTSSSSRFFFFFLLLHPGWVVGGHGGLSRPQGGSPGPT